MGQVIKKRSRPAGSKNRVLQPKVTVLSVRREWEKKYAELKDAFDQLAQAHIELAGRADLHFADSKLFKNLAENRLVELHRHQGVIIYLENKLQDLEN